MQFSFHRIAVPRASTGFVAFTLLAALVVFQKTRIGRALRAVADDHQAAQSVGIPLNVIWVIVWAIADGRSAARGVDAFLMGASSLPAAVA